YPSAFRFFTPIIWESFDFSGYDVVISSSGWFMCKGIITRPETLHLSYIHHQNKFLTYYETPDNWKTNWLKRLYGYLVGTPLRMWDFVSSSRPDIMVANSKETASRIAKYYRRESVVLYPPVFDPKIKLTEKYKKTKDYYITVNRLSKPKHIEVLIEAANELGITLYVVGTGREFGRLKAQAKKNVIFTGEISDAELSRLYMGAKGFLFASVDEEFGIAPVEAMMHGIPVIAYKSGGLKETVKDGSNGFLVDKLNSQEYIKAIRKLEKQNYQRLASNSYHQAKKYSREVFQQKLLDLVSANLKDR
ncbi:hypothetical protein A2459_00995, partial [Candidatus Roizmanbacteria bacterium RIFOXYC2_FULL_41_10]